MSATRLLVLGAVRVHGTAHGYLVQNEFLAWGAHDWANVKWGSIYHALKQMTKQGLLTSHEVNDGSWRVDYTITELGESEFLRLVRDALSRPEHRTDAFAAGLAFFTALPRAEVISLLRDRIEALEAQRAEKAAQERDFDKRADRRVGHVRELFGLWGTAVDTGIEWTNGLIERLENGEYVMAGEGPTVFGSPGSSAIAAD